jgi:predicted NACHT family NTPase
MRPCRSTEKLFNFAKTKGSNGEIPQDFRIIFDNIEIANPKILIIGDYGSGKTHSLRTLAGVDFDAVKQLPLM